MISDVSLANSTAHILSYIILLNKETQDYFDNCFQLNETNFSLHDCLVSMLEIMSAFARDRNTELQLSFPPEIENHIVFSDMGKIELIFLCQIMEEI